MRSEWKTVTLADVLQKKGYIRGPFGSALKRGDMQTEGIPVYEQQHAIYNHRNFRFYIDTEKFESLKRFQVRENDLIISCSGTVGKVTIISKDDPKGIISQALLLLRVNTGVISPKFLQYFFSSQKGYNAIISRSSGSVQVNIAKREVIEQIPILLPPMDIQERIVRVLENLDDKIFLNQKINNNLEQQAQAIFKEWFVDDPEIVTDNWITGNLLDIADYLNGLAMQKYRPEDGDSELPVLKIKELRQKYCDSNSERCSSLIKPEYIVHDGDVVFSWSGSLLVDLWCGGTCGLNQHLFKVTSKRFDKWFYYMWTKHHLNRFIAVAADKATTMGHIKRSELEKAEVLIPSRDDYKEIGSVLQPMIDQIIANRIESRTLAALRDSLLPKLMSGEIDVSDINY